MSRLAVLEIYNERFHFSAAHFTIFSKTRREPLHGHDFQVRARVSARVAENGLCFDYQLIKDALEQLCLQLNQRVLLPAKSSYLDIDKDATSCRVRVQDDVYEFPARDVLLLPVVNISVEELSYYFAQALHKAPGLTKTERIEVSVSSGIGQRGHSTWQADNKAETSEQT